jgi:hypothetical protein
MTTTLKNGRLCNQIIRNLAVSIVATKHDLFVSYYNYDLIVLLGIHLFCGVCNYNDYVDLTDDNYMNILTTETPLCKNLNPNKNYFQTKAITNILFQYLRSTNKQQIMNVNPFSNRYDNNDDLFIHIRLTDVERFNPGLNYYLYALSTISFQTCYIASDNLQHSIICEILKKYPGVVLVDKDEIQTIQFGSTCKYVVLSHGSFSAVIGYLSFFSNVYYPDYGKNMWFGDMFSVPGFQVLQPLEKVVSIETVVQKPTLEKVVPNPTLIQPLERSKYKIVHKRFLMRFC